ncbi:hypothetical protein [Spirosoma jeollabukense]
MKLIFVSLIIIAMFSFSCSSSKNIVYGSDGKSKEIEREESHIIFSNDKGFPIKTTQEADFVSALLPGLVDVAFKLTDTILSNKIKQYSAEYIIQKSYLDPNKSMIPAFTFQKVVKLKNGSQEIALEIDFSTEKVLENKSMVYYISRINLKNSKAKITDKYNTLDYSIELKPVLVINGKKESQNLTPIVINSVKFVNHPVGETNEDLIKDSKRYRSDIILIPPGAFLSEIQLKIVETNPHQIKLEKILETFNTYKDEGKTIINNFISGKDSNAPVSNTPGTGSGQAPQGSPRKP